MDILNDKNVAVYKSPDTSYPKVKPFHPSVRYPEIDYSTVSNEINPVFDAVRSILALLDKDKANFGKSCWNPFGDFIHPDNTVLIKPNLVSHFNWGYKSGLTDTESLITHGSVIRAVIDYVIIALKGKGKIIIGDSPVQLSNWDDIMEMIGFNEMKLFFEASFPQISIISQDFRLCQARRDWLGNIKKYQGSENFSDYVEADLGQFSLLAPITLLNTSYGVVDYPKKRLGETHNLINHKYLFPRQVLNADAIINLPKLKTHSKAGFSCSLKNLVGLIGHKDYLPHFRFGSERSGGDEYPDRSLLFHIINNIAHREWEYSSGFIKGSLGVMLKILKLIYLLLTGHKREIFNVAGGGWYGNDTLWRTILDINRAFFYTGADLKIKDINISNKKYFTLTDGIIGGEKLSPLLPTPVKAGLIIAGHNPVAVDTVASALIGLDYKKISQINRTFNLSNLPLLRYSPEEIFVHSNKTFKTVNDIISGSDKTIFEPSPGYRGHIEI